MKIQVVYHYDCYSHTTPNYEFSPFFNFGEKSSKVRYFRIQLYLVATKTRLLIRILQLRITRAGLGVPTKSVYLGNNITLRKSSS